MSEKNMNSVLKKLWYPSEEDIFGSGMLWTISLPVLLFLEYVIKISYSIFWGFLLIFVIQGVMTIRGSMTLPIQDDFVTKFQSLSSKSLKVIRVLAFTLPILSLFTLLIISEFFYISYILSVIASLSFFSYSRIQPILYTILSALLSLSALTVLIIQGTLFWMIIYILFIIMALPVLIAHYIKSNRLKMSLDS